MTSYILVLIFSILIIPINTYWLIYTTTKWYAPPTSVALHSNVIFIVFIYSMAVLVYNRLFHKQTGQSSNRTVMFIMLSLSTAISGYHWSMVLIPQMSSVFWFATPENEWRELIWPHVPQWLTVSDKAVLRYYLSGRINPLHHAAYQSV